MIIPNEPVFIGLATYLDIKNPRWDSHVKRRGAGRKF